MRTSSRNAFSEHRIPNSPRCEACFYYAKIYENVGGEKLRPYSICVLERGDRARGHGVDSVPTHLPYAEQALVLKVVSSDSKNCLRDDAVQNRRCLVSCILIAVREM